MTRKPELAGRVAAVIAAPGRGRRLGPRAKKVKKGGTRRTNEGVARRRKRRPDEGEAGAPERQRGAVGGTTQRRVRTAASR